MALNHKRKEQNYALCQAQVKVVKVSTPSEIKAVEVVFTNIKRFINFHNFSNVAYLNSTTFIHLPQHHEIDLFLSLSSLANGVYSLQIFKSYFFLQWAANTVNFEVCHWAMAYFYACNLPMPMNDFSLLGIIYLALLVHFCKGTSRTYSQMHTTLLSQFSASRLIY